MTEVVDPVADVDRAIYELLRKLNPRAVARQCEGNDGPAVPLGAVPLLQAVAGGECGPQGCEVTVGMVAERLALDPSRASRAVAAAIEAGHVTRLASQADGRRSVLALTPAGREILDAADHFRQSRYGKLLAAWPADDRTAFAHLLRRFVEEL